MTPDLKRLCEVASAVYLADTSEITPNPDNYPGAFEAIVRAVLVALKEPSDDAIDATFELTGNGDRVVEAMIDFILAEPATA